LTVWGKRVVVSVLVASVAWEALAVWWALGTDWRYAGWVPILSPFVGLSIALAVAIIDGAITAGKELFSATPNRPRDATSPK
jgi:hypothetical protein